MEPGRLQSVEAQSSWTWLSDRKTTTMYHCPVDILSLCLFLYRRANWSPNRWSNCSEIFLLYLRPSTVFLFECILFFLIIKPIENISFNLMHGSPLTHFLYQHTNTYTHKYGSRGSTVQEQTDMLLLIVSYAIDLNLNFLSWSLEYLRYSWLRPN